MTVKRLVYIYKRHKFTMLYQIIINVFFPRPSSSPSNISLFALIVICAGIESVGLLNVVSIFVIIGIGVDDVFVFINTFKQSSSPRSTDYFRELVRLNAPRVSFLRSRDEREQREILEGEYRITHTILHATKATFITSFTTSVAFFANAVSTVSE